MTIRVTAYGSPAPQGSKRHVGRGVMIGDGANIALQRLANLVPEAHAHCPCGCGGHVMCFNDGAANLAPEDR